VNLGLLPLIGWALIGLGAIGVAIILWLVAIARGGDSDD